jgi:hypothetical protein
MCTVLLAVALSSAYVSPDIKELTMRITDRRGYITLAVFVGAIILFAVGTYYMTAGSRSVDARTSNGIPLGSSTVH